MENDIVRMLFLRRQRQKKRWKIKTINGAPPLSFKAKAGALRDYRIYGNTANGESVGDRTGNLCENSISGVNISSNGFIYADIHNDVGYAKVVAGETYTINSYVYAFFEEEPKEGDRSYDNGRVVGTSPSTFEAPINGYVAFRTESGSQLQCNEGNNLLPYEPYGYRVPVTVTNNNNSQTTNLYLPEQIRKVGVDAEYIEYGEQKQHRVRVNLSEVNEFSNSITDTSDKLQIWVQQGKNDSFVYPSQSKIFVITEPTAITTSITITNDNDSIRIKQNGSKIDIVIDIVRGLSPGAYSVSFNVLNYDHTTVGGLVINNIMVNKGSTALPYEPYIENTEVDVTLPSISTLAGTNVLTVGTAVQPSDVYIKGKIKKGE